MWFSNIDNQNWFIIVFDDDTFSVKDERELSRMIDMADTGTMDDVFGIFKIIDNEFLEVKTEGFRRINTDEEMPLRYAQTDLYVERLGKHEVVGSVTLTDH